MNLLVIQISNVIFAKIFHGHPQYLCYRYNLSRWPNWPIYKVKQVPERFAMSFLQKTFVQVSQDISYGADWSRQEK
ncbi:hypothetical protein H5410_056471 [Solanum commersonii]|uniref:Uncharacterized protein n=1 Tax=Solanum commersonii TaxID=4109 RepID=A0A9J5WKB5_SOLCO|nr:hypothetical protein H5410_056471 [Solanum commersonii]